MAFQFSVDGVITEQYDVELVHKKNEFVTKLRYPQGVKLSDTVYYITERLRQFFVTSPFLQMLDYKIELMPFNNLIGITWEENK